MSNIKHHTDASLADFLARWRRITTDDTDVAELTRGGYALIGLTNFGERPVPSTRLAGVLGWSVGAAEALALHGGGERGSRTGSSPSTPGSHDRLPGGTSRSVTAGSG